MADEAEGTTDITNTSNIAPATTPQTDTSAVDLTAGQATPPQATPPQQTKEPWTLKDTFRWMVSLLRWMVSLLRSHNSLLDSHLELQRSFFRPQQGLIELMRLPTPPTLTQQDIATLANIPSTAFVIPAAPIPPTPPMTPVQNTQPTTPSETIHAHPSEEVHPDKPPLENTQDFDARFQQNRRWHSRRQNDTSDSNHTQQAQPAQPEAKQHHQRSHHHRPILSHQSHPRQSEQPDKQADHRKPRGRR